MPTLVLKDRVKVTSTTTGTSDFTLGAASTGYQGFTAIGDGNQTYYCIAMQGGAQWEVGYGQVSTSGTVLVRQSVYSNSLGDTSFIDFPAGTKEVFCTYPSEQAVFQEVNGSMKLINGVIEVSEDGTSGTTLPNTAYQAFTTGNYYMQSNMQNLSDGALASSDWVCTADNGTDEENYIDMGMNSSGYNNPDVSATKANDGYIINTGNNLVIVAGKAGAVTPGAQDIIFVAGSLLDTEERVRVYGTSGNVNIGGGPAPTDTGEKLQVEGSAKITGAAAFGSTVLLDADPTTALQAATKQYVDNAVSSGIHIHTQVYAETSAALAAAYTQGGTTDTVTTITNTDTVTFNSATPSLNDEIWFYSTAGNGLSANVAYFVAQVVSPGVVKLSLTPGGASITGLTNASGLTYAVRINSGVGAYLESSANETFAISGVTGLTTGQRILVYNQSTGYWNGVYTITSMGSGASKWKLTRATDQDQYAPHDTNGLGEGDYFFITTNTEAYVLTTTGTIIIGYTALTYTLFSAATVYTGTSPVVVTGSVISLDTVPVAKGGTNLTSATTGDLLYASTTNTWASLGIGSTYQVLTVSGGVPTWGGVALDQSAAISGSLPATNGGTGQNSYAVGDLLYSATTNTLSKLAGNTTTTKLFLTQTGTGSASQAPAWAAVTSGDISGLGTMASQDASSVAITGGTIESTKFQAYTETVTTVGTVSTSTYNINLALSNIFDITLGNNVTFTFTNAPSSGINKNCTVILRQDASGNRTATFTNAKYTDGTAPILSTGANQIDVLSFFTVNGGSFWFGTYAMANVS